MRNINANTTFKMQQMIASLPSLRNKPFLFGVCIGLLMTVTMVKFHGLHVRDHMVSISKFTFYMGCSMHIIGLIGENAEGLDRMQLTPLTFPLLRAYLATKTK